MSGEVELTSDDLRVVARYVAEVAEELLPRFETGDDDPRPRVAIEAAWTFVGGAPRTKLQRVASIDAHRAARETPTEVARLSAQAAGDAASAAYLHPIFAAHQVGHILRAAANAARVAEIEAGEDPDVAEVALDRVRRRADPALVDVLRRYPPAQAGGGRVARLMASLDAALRRGG